MELSANYRAIKKYANKKAFEPLTLKTQWPRPSFTGIGLNRRRQFKCQCQATQSLHTCKPWDRVGVCVLQLSPALVGTVGVGVGRRVVSSGGKMGAISVVVRTVASSRRPKLARLPPYGFRGGSWCDKIRFLALLPVGRAKLLNGI